MELVRHTATEAILQKENILVEETTDTQVGQPLVHIVETTAGDTIVTQCDDYHIDTDEDDRLKGEVTTTEKTETVTQSLEANG